MKRKSICILPNRLIIGGIEKVLIDALWALHEKYDIEIVLFVDEPCQAIIDNIPPDVKVTIRELPESKFLRFCSNIPYLSKFYFNKALGDKFYDYLIVLRSSIIQACFSNKAKYKIYWGHNDFYQEYIVPQLSFKMRIKKHILKMIYKKYDMVWTVSKTIEDEIRNGLSLKNIYALANPVNCAGILNRAEEKCDFIFDKAKTNIVMLGRISKEKGFHRVLRFMCSEVFARYPNTHLYIIGDGYMKEAYKKRIQEYGLEDKISFLGEKANPYPYLRQAQLLVCPSTNESFGLAIMEAMLLKIPVITTDTVGGRYTTQDGKYGRCVENNDAALQKAVEEFLDATSAYEYSLGDAQRWAYQHDIEIFGEKILNLLKDCT